MKGIKMNNLYGGASVGRKNVLFGIALFVVLGVAAGIPLTIDFLGGSILSSEQYQMWKVVHGYGVFLSFVNFFFGLCVDHLSLPRQQKELASWTFLLAGVVGGLVRMALVLLGALGEWGIYASLVESALFVLGTVIVVRGQVQPQPERRAEPRAHARSM
jgi:hypothetical protein